MKALRSDELYTRCDLSKPGFETTKDLKELDEIAGQDRALEAIRFGVDIKQDGYNLFVMGPSGMGKCSTTRQYLEQQAAKSNPPDDWCYVNNFESPQKPKLLRFPAGNGKKFRNDIKELIDDLLSVIPSAFESDQYQIRAEEIEENIRELSEKAIKELSGVAESHGVRLVKTRRGFSFQPIKKGEVVAPKEFDQFSEDDVVHNLYPKAIDYSLSALKSSLIKAGFTENNINIKINMVPFVRDDGDIVYSIILTIQIIIR